jgi:polar amino acid transport system substrate-binding protein
MTARSARRCLFATAAVLASVAMLATGCGDQTDDSGGGSSSGSSGGPKSSAAPLFDKLPSKYQSSKVIKVGSDIAYPPVEFKKNGATVGMDPDLADALGKQLGVKFEFENGTFDTLLTGLRANRYDIAMSAMSDTKDRQNGIDPDTGKKVGPGVDFVDYFTAGASIYVKKGNPAHIKGWDDLCGKKIVLERGTVSHDLAKAEAKKCQKSGKGKLSIEAFSTDIEAQTRLRGGGGVAASSDFPVAAYAAKTSGGGNDFEIVGQQVEAGPYGIAVSKENTELRDVLQDAINAIIKNGDYGKVMDKWGVADGAVTEARINGGS